ncbi:hypothetical protein [Lactiplantibacillus plantarum]|uniref:hypothetical protein n=1 Tax=Lactiplantibacillus plantarum TaxID=1590 RepID=UPI000978B7F9|nr:hypothetical protein [Lactiplantibacillus plantarum]
MNKQDLLEFSYYLKHRIRAWLSQYDDNRTYIFVKNIANRTWIFLCQIYYENLYLAMKNSLLKQSYSTFGHPQIKWIILSAIYMILMLHFHVLIFVGLIFLVIQLLLRHQRYMRDVSCVAIQLIAGQLSDKSIKDLYYTYPFQEFRVLFNLCQLLTVNQKHIEFDDFIADGSLQVIGEKGLGRLITFKINVIYYAQHLDDINDYALTKLRLLPDEDSGEYIKNGWLKQDLIALINDTLTDEIVQKMIANEIYTCYPSVKTQIEQMKMQEAQAQQNIQQQLYIQEHHLPDKIRSVWRFFDLKSGEVGFSYWDNNSNSVTGNNNYLRIRMRLIDKNTYSDAKEKTNLVSKELRCNVLTAPIVRDPGSFWMTFIFSEITSPKTASVKTIKEDAGKGNLAIGNSVTGRYIVKLPRGDDLLAILCGAQSRNGKSTMITQVILSLLYLKTKNGFDYSDVFIATVKDEDYITNGFKSSGMLVESEPMRIYKMLQYLDIKATKRKKLFIKNGVKNIKEFNHKFPERYLGKQLLIFDEYANTLASAESERVEIAGRKVKLREAIEQLMLKISQEHASRGVSLIVITQQFAKNQVGRLFDAMNVQLLGYARANVWNSIDNSQEMSRYIESKRDDRRGLFFINAPDLPAQGEQVVFNAGYTEIRTANIETDEVRRDFDRHFETSREYQRISGEAPINDEVEPLNLIKASNILK